MLPDDIQWCFDRADHLSFKDFIEAFDCLDRHHAQQRFDNILSKHFNTKSERDLRINGNYKTWTKSSDDSRFWTLRGDSINITKANLTGAEMVDSALDHRLASSRSADHSLQQALVDSDESTVDTPVPHPGSNSKIETILSIDDETVILHEETRPIRKGNPYIFKNTNITQLAMLLL